MKRETPKNCLCGGKAYYRHYIFPFRDTFEHFDMVVCENYEYGESGCKSAIQKIEIGLRGNGGEAIKIWNIINTIKEI